VYDIVSTSQALLLETWTHSVTSRGIKLQLHYASYYYYYYYYYYHHHSLNGSSDSVNGDLQFLWEKANFIIKNECHSNIIVDRLQGCGIHVQTAVNRGKYIATLKGRYTILTIMGKYMKN